MYRLACGLVYLHRSAGRREGWWGGWDGWSDTDHPSPPFSAWPATACPCAPRVRQAAEGRPALSDGGARQTAGGRPEAAIVKGYPYPTTISLHARLYPHHPSYIQTCLYPNLSIYQPVYIPTLLYTSQSISQPEYLRACLYSNVSRYKSVYISMGVYSC
jgi:hypothetical protein